MLVKKNILILFFICLLIPGLISLYLWRFVGIDFLVRPDKYWDQFLKKIPNLTDYQWYMLFHETPKTELFEKFGKQASEPCYLIKTKIGEYYLCKILPTKYLPNYV